MWPLRRPLFCNVLPGGPVTRGARMPRPASEERTGGGGVRNDKFGEQKWPQSIFRLVTCSFSHCKTPKSGSRGGGVWVWVWMEPFHQRHPCSQAVGSGRAGRLFGLVRHLGAATAVAAGRGPHGRVVLSLCRFTVAVTGSVARVTAGVYHPDEPQQPPGPGAVHSRTATLTSCHRAPLETNVGGPYLVCAPCAPLPCCALLGPVVRVHHVPTPPGRTCTATRATVGVIHRALPAAVTRVTAQQEPSLSASRRGGGGGGAEGVPGGGGVLPPPPRASLPPTVLRCSCSRATPPPPLKACSAGVVSSPAGLGGARQPPPLWRSLFPAGPPRQRVARAVVRHRRPRPRDVLGLVNNGLGGEGGPWSPPKFGGRGLEKAAPRARSIFSLPHLAPTIFLALKRNRARNARLFAV